MTPTVQSFARKGLWLLPIWAILLFLSTLTHQPSPQTAFADFSAYITTRQFLISHLVGSIAGAALGSIGAVALMLNLQETRAAGRAITGMAALIAGNTFTTAVFGAAAFAQPAMGRMFLAGQSNAQEFYNQVYGAPLFLTVIIGLLLLIVSGVFLGSAIAVSGRLPRWAGWVFAVALAGFVFSSIFFDLGTSIFSALLILSSVVVAWNAPRVSPPQYATAGAPAIR
jgi:hypothetical protein